MNPIGALTGCAIRECGPTRSRFQRSPDAAKPQSKNGYRRAGYAGYQR